MKKLFLACIVACGLAAPAFGADVGVLAPAYQPIAVRPIYTWTGCYAGVNAGGGGAPQTWTDVKGTLVLPGGSLGDHTARGVVGGGQLGCDVQFGSFVFGAQGLYDLTGMKGNNFQPNRFFLNNSFVQSVATLTARAGFTPKPNVLLYAKGGGAWVHDLYNVSTPPGAGIALVPGTLVISLVGPAFQSGTILALGRNTSGGWTVGGGVEWAPFGGDWTVSLEYSYMNFGTSRVAFLPTVTNNISAVPIDITQTAQVVLFGLNYRFLGGPPRY
jgi:outer membrane immunogenic protein